MDKIAGNGDIKAAIIIGAGRVFIAGADVREFGKPPLPPTLPEAITAIPSFTSIPTAAPTVSVIPLSISKFDTCH
jgi:3-hydroxyacyl-CoA dehydrogenase